VGLFVRLEKGEFVQRQTRHRQPLRLLLMDTGWWMERELVRALPADGDEQRASIGGGGLRGWGWGWIAGRRRRQVRTADDAQLDARIDEQSETNGILSTAQEPLRPIDRIKRPKSYIHPSFIETPSIKKHVKVKEERERKGERTSCTPADVLAPIDGLQKRLDAPLPSKAPFCPFAATTTADARRIGFGFGFGRRRKRGLRQDIVRELDDARAERVGALLRGARGGEGGGRRAQVSGVFFAYDGVVRKGVREDRVDDRLCGIIGHLEREDQGGVVFFRAHGGVPVTGLLSPLTSVSPATSLLKTVMVSAHARRTAAMATCCSRANGTGMGVKEGRIDREIIGSGFHGAACVQSKKGFYHANTIMRSQPNASPPPSLSLSRLYKRR